MTNKEPKIALTYVPREKYTLISINLSGPISPADMLSMDDLPDVVATRRASLGVVISGRGPIWLYGFLAHHYHPCAWVGMYDPRLQGAVVVQSHSTKYSVGDVVSVKL